MLACFAVCCNELVLHYYKLHQIHEELIIVIYIIDTSVQHDIQFDVIFPNKQTNIPQTANVKLVEAALLDLPHIRL